MSSRASPDSNATAVWVWALIVIVYCWPSCFKNPSVEKSGRVALIGSRARRLGSVVATRGIVECLSLWVAIRGSVEWSARRGGTVYWPWYLGRIVFAVVVVTVCVIYIHYAIIVFILKQRSQLFSHLIWAGFSLPVPVHLMSLFNVPFKLFSTW